MDKNEFERRMATAATDHASGVRSNLTQISGEHRAADAALSDKRDAARTTERAGELREDREVGMQLDPIQSPER